MLNDPDLGINPSLLKSDDDDDQIDLDERIIAQTPRSKAKPVAVEEQSEETYSIDMHYD